MFYTICWAISMEMEQKSQITEDKSRVFVLDAIKIYSGKKEEAISNLFFPNHWLCGRAPCWRKNMRLMYNVGLYIPLEV